MSVGRWLYWYPWFMNAFNASKLLGLYFKIRIIILLISTHLVQCKPCTIFLTLYYAEEVCEWHPTWVYKGWCRPSSRRVQGWGHLNFASGGGKYIPLLHASVPIPLILGCMTWHLSVMVNSLAITRYLLEGCNRNNFLVILRITVSVFMLFYLWSTAPPHKLSFTNDNNVPFGAGREGTLGYLLH